LVLLAIIVINNTLKKEVAAMKKNIEGIEIEVINNHRFYLYPIEKKDKQLNFTTPQEIYYAGRAIDFVAGQKSWKTTIVSLFNYLYNMNPISDSEIINYVIPWLGRPIISKSEHYKASTVLCNGLYINLSFNSTQYYWILGDIIDLFKMDRNLFKVLLFFEPIAENRKLLSYIKDKNRNQFELYLKEKSLNFATIMKNVDTINTIFAKESSYVDLYYFDDHTRFYNEVHRFLRKISQKGKLDYAQKFEGTLKYLKDFYSDTKNIEFRY
jgi:hypothetical protein